MDLGRKPRLVHTAVRILLLKHMRREAWLEATKRESTVCVGFILSEAKVRFGINGRALVVRS